MASTYTVPGLDQAKADQVVETLQGRLTAMIDLQLTLKHIHWNVVGSNFIAVHELLDTQTTGAREMSDALAERIATLGGEPTGTPGFVVKHRTWDDYGLGRDLTDRHLEALDHVYNGLLTDHRAAIAEFDELDLVSQDLLITQARELEEYQWFVRAHLQGPDGSLRRPSAEGR